MEVTPLREVLLVTADEPVSLKALLANIMVEILPEAVLLCPEVTVVL
jgi:hypothetical protein